MMDSAWGAEKSFHQDAIRMGPLRETGMREQKQVPGQRKEQRQNSVLGKYIWTRAGVSVVMKTASGEWWETCGELERLDPGHCEGCPLLEQGRDLDTPHVSNPTHF